MARRILKRPRRTRLVYATQVLPPTVKHTYQTASVDDVFHLILQSINGENITDSCLFDGRFNFSIRVCGDQWTGNIDYNIASFFIKLQNSIIQLHNKYSDKKVKINTLYASEKDLILHVRLEDGSTKILIYLEKCLKHIAKMVDGMESKDKKQVLIAFATMGMITTCVTIGSCKHFETQARIVEAQVQKEIKIEDEKTKQMLASVAVESSRNAIAMTAPFADLAKQMQANDRMRIGGITYTPHEAEEAFKQQPEAEREIPEKTFTIDGEYDITDVSLVHNSIMAKKEGKKRKIITRFLPDAEKDRLHKMYRDSQLVNDYPRNIPLQVSVTVKDGKWIEAHIFGIGPARVGAISIAKALELSVPNRKRKQEQGSLLAE